VPHIQLQALTNYLIEHLAVGVGPWIIELRQVPVFGAAQVHFLQVRSAQDHLNTQEQRGKVFDFAANSSIRHTQSLGLRFEVFDIGLDNATRRFDAQRVTAARTVELCLFAIQCRCAGLQHVKRHLHRFGRLQLEKVGQFHIDQPDMAKLEAAVFLHRHTVDPAEVLNQTQVE
jgi:hypothetical protein